ncbi:hypothetical protein [Mycobacterium sp. SMC-4]|uniref:hypothetical protein n=1 Tax=Mycobacterium sp. SMC-4 TaxID=2857059 RepID=UPI0021B1A25F|nr:hypothetical protein [Mycobacterium sp. SMC-4]UXA20125.1 hypothetical protein KXD98_11405 [Mycobacterium sp. SMC-4]
MVTVDDDSAVEVSDNGCGTSEDLTASGLASLQQRAEKAAGSATVRSAPKVAPVC